jgi:hypothetical protein
VLIHDVVSRCCECETSFCLTPKSIQLLPKLRAFCGAIYEVVTNTFGNGLAEQTAKPEMATSDAEDGNPRS